MTMPEPISDEVSGLYGDALVNLANLSRRHLRHSHSDGVLLALDINRLRQR